MMILQKGYCSPAAAFVSRKNYITSRRAKEEHKSNP